MQIIVLKNPISQGRNDILVVIRQEHQHHHSSNMSITAHEYLESQKKLEEEARDTLPFAPDTCSYNLGSIRQPVFACLTCNKPSGMCYSCSIQCHSTHEIVELFTKRNFVCDCGTERAGNLCSLRHNTEPDIPSSTNMYSGRNFTHGEFCVCQQTYDPEKETGDMIQCIFGLKCNEEWYHDYCIMGRKKGADMKDFPNVDTFDTFICWQCVEPYMDIFDEMISELGVTVDHGEAESNAKRKRAAYSIFIRENYEEVFTRIRDTSQNPRVVKFLEDCGWLCKDDPIYEPPEDSDDGSIYDLGAKALESLPREKAADTIAAYNLIKQRLTEFLQPFADEGKIVQEDDIKKFFSK